MEQLVYFSTDLHLVVKRTFSVVPLFLLISTSIGLEPLINQASLKIFFLIFIFLMFHNVQCKSKINTDYLKIRTYFNFNLGYFASVQTWYKSSIDLLSIFI